MVNIVAALKPLLHGVMKLAGVTPLTVEIEPGTVMNFWVPKETIDESKHQTQKWTKPNKPVVVLAHPFGGDGILMWFPQVLALAHDYSVYVPDFVFFGGSTTTTAERSPVFQAECLARGLRKLGVEKCSVVGLSYGGMVGFKMAKMYPDLVESMVVSSTVMEMTESISNEFLAKIGVSRWSEFLLPETLDGIKLLLSFGFHKLPWLPDFLYQDMLEVLVGSRPERAQLLEALVVSDEDSIAPLYSQRIHFLWADKEKIFDLELAQKMKEQIGERATLSWVENAGHLVQLERPFAYNRELKRILASFYADRQQQK